VRKQKEHQQSPAPGSHIDPPGEIIMNIFSREARIHMPTCITRVLRTRKTHRKGAEAVTGKPMPKSCQPVKGCVQHWRVGSLPERCLGVISQPYHRPPPRSRIVRVTTCITP